MIGLFGYSLDRVLGQDMDLSTLAIILPLASEPFAGQPLTDLTGAQYGL